MTIGKTEFYYHSTIGNKLYLDMSSFIFGIPACIGAGYLVGKSCTFYRYLMLIGNQTLEKGIILHGKITSEKVDFDQPIILSARVDNWDMTKDINTTQTKWMNLYNTGHRKAKILDTENLPKSVVKDANILFNDQTIIANGVHASHMPLHTYERGRYLQNFNPTDVPVAIKIIRNYDNVCAFGIRQNDHINVEYIGNRKKVEKLIRQKYKINTAAIALTGLLTFYCGKNALNI